MQQPRLFQPERGLHAIEDFRAGGKDYLAGEVWPTEGIAPADVQTMWIAWKVNCGPAPQQLAASAKARRAELAKAKGREERERARELKMAQEREAEEAAIAEQDAKDRASAPRGVLTVAPDEEMIDDDELEALTAPPSLVAGARVPAAGATQPQGRKLEEVSASSAPVGTRSPVVGAPRR